MSERRPFLFIIKSTPFMRLLFFFPLHDDRVEDIGEGAANQSPSNLAAGN